MNRPTAIVFSGAIALALVAGAASRDLTLHAPPAAPAVYVVQTTAPASSPAPARTVPPPAEGYD